LREFGLSKFSTLLAFSKALGVSATNLNSYLVGRRLPGNKMKFRLRELGADIDWIMEGKKPTESSNMRPVYAAVPAGRGRVSEMPFTYEEAPPGVDDDGKGYWLRVKGDSMYPALRDGQLVFVNPEREVHDNDFAVVVWNDHEEGAIKEVHFTAKDVILSSINQIHKPIIVPRDTISLIARICYVKF
jgi:phage repressor protein C with HTH and peptisase S24 domain